MMAPVVPHAHRSLPTRLLASLSTTLLATWALGCTPSRSAKAPPTPSEPIALTSLAEGVFVHTSWKTLPKVGPFPSNGLLLCHDGVGFVVDTAWTEAQTVELLDMAAAQGCPVRGLLVTHFHDDRTGGLGEILRRRIPTFASPKTAAKAPVKNWQPHLVQDGPLDVEAGPAVQIFNPGPAHTDDNIVVWLPESKVLFGGCLVRPLEGNNLGNLEDANVSAWPLSIRKVQERYPHASHVVPGHGPPGGVELLEHTKMLADAAADTLVPATAPTALTQGPSRSLGDHVFPFGGLVPSAFPASYFGLRAGAVLRNVPKYPSQEGPVDLEDLGVLEGMDMGVRLHDRISLFGDANGRARGGTNVRSLLGTGAHFQYDAGMGGLLKILRHEKTGTQVAARLGLGFYGGQEVGIGAFASSLARTVRGAINEVRREVESKQIPTVEEVTPKLTAAAAMIRQLFANADDLLLTPFSGRQTSLQLTAAQALSRHVGLQAYAGWRWATLTAKATRFRGTSPILSIDLDQSISAPEGGVAADFDGASLGIPLDLILEYAVAYPTTQTTSQTSSGEAERKDSRFEQSLASGLYYSGRPNLQLGVHAHATFEKQPVSTLLPSTTEAQSANDVLASEALSGPPSEMGGQFVFRYIW